MKFEQLLQIYWSRGFLYGGKSEKYNLTLDNFFLSKRGLNAAHRRFFIKRFELNFLINNHTTTFLAFDHDFRKLINMYLSQLTSINHSIDELVRYNMIRLYLIKTFRGRCLAMGKPSRGQRTWSNAWTAFRYNLIIKKFITDVKKFNVITKTVESLNKKFIKKKTKIKKPKIKMIFTKKKKNFWF